MLRFVSFLQPVILVDNDKLLTNAFESPPVSVWQFFCVCIYFLLCIVFTADRHIVHVAHIVQL